MPPSQRRREPLARAAQEHRAAAREDAADYGVTARSRRSIPGRPSRRTRSSPEAGTKVLKVAGLADDLALGLVAQGAHHRADPRQEPHRLRAARTTQRMPVNLRELDRGPALPEAAKAPLPVVLGRDIVGAPFYADLASMPHVIVAGATGAGKSVGLNVMLVEPAVPAHARRAAAADDRSRRSSSSRRSTASRTCCLPVVTDMKQAATALQVGGRRDGAALPAVRQRRHEEHRRPTTAGSKRVRRGELPAPRAGEGRAPSTPTASRW